MTLVLCVYVCVCVFCTCDKSVLCVPDPCRHHAADVRRTVSSNTTGKDPSRSTSVSTLSAVSLNDTLQENVEPVDYEDFVDQHQCEADRDPHSKILYFPPDDIVVSLIPRQIRTIHPIVPEQGDSYDAHVADCVRCYTRDWLHISRQYVHHSTSVPALNQVVARHLSELHASHPPEFEVDLEDDRGHGSGDRHDPGGNRHSSHLSDTPRGSWASSVFDLRNSVADPLLPALLTRVPLDTVDTNNQQARQDNRQDSLFVLYPPQDEEDLIERRLYPEVPLPHQAHRIQVKCINLRLELEIEPIFATMALYNLRDKKKVSENFCFDMNPEPLKRMLTSHIPYQPLNSHQFLSHSSPSLPSPLTPPATHLRPPPQDISTLSRTCVFDITYPSSDLFLVVRLEKVLQGDISDVVGPYMKDDANREKLKSAAVACCERLGKYRMPLAWTAINLMNIFNGVHSERENAPEREPSGSNSLDRKQSSSSYDELKRKSGSGSLTAAGLPGTPQLQRETAQLVAGGVRDVPRLFPARHPHCVLLLQADEKCRPIKEMVEFPPRDILVPHYFCRNLLFIAPKELNFNNRPGSARNIAVKIQFMAGEEEHGALSVMFGKSSCPEFTSEAYTAVTYHNKSPDFYDEFKVKLPAVLGDQHHILFTFYHISCQKKNEEKTIETPVGYTWLPVYRDGSLQTGEHSLPVMMERPPSNYPYITADIQLPGTKWVDNHKGLFTVNVEAISSVHAQEGNIPARIGESKMEGELKKA
ncbi:Dedicator of cytokinesis protein 7 [Chionoecetes opilio]|uniref:Dedicator of cytokinesis protein 7 n=1 Tax=Chionoecetes opilio TaxID=41210 RepID=A0A8J4Y051_CHIOP|nr:Dedicator of cytokinesis protein 7 [Chionoecetes opilio]